MRTKVETIDLWLPFGIQSMVEFMPGNIITIAGDQNAGKTAFLLNVIYKNLDRFEIHYFNSEMGAPELKKRLLLFDRFPIAHKNLYAYEREFDFSDVIRPGQGVLNIVDYLELTEDFYKVGKYLGEIHSKLDGALAIVAIQKRHPDSDDALGGKRALEKPRLALSMSQGGLKIIKAKNWRTEINPNGKSITFKLVHGCKFKKTSEWS